MKFTELGQTGKKISQIGLGTWQFGSKGWGYGKDFDKKGAISIVQKALELKVNLIDTAEAYGRGESERIIGEALQGFDRKNVVLVSKFLPITIRPSNVRRALKKSLKRLQTDYLDVYLIHWPNPILPWGRTLDHMADMVDEGLINHIGISNFSLSWFKKAQKKAKYRIEVNQINYSLTKATPKTKFLPYAGKNQITVMAYSPLSQGFLTGKYTPENVPQGQRRLNRIFRKKNFERATSLLSVLNEIAEENKATMAQVALNWLIQDKSVVAIPGAKNVHQLEDNTKAADINLSIDNLKQLYDEISRFKSSRFF
jgi:aryl-alcohol dehydrogenase-like predicted oxidoreductase